MQSEADGIVSLWIGHFANEDALFAYVDMTYDVDGKATCAFANDAGIGWFDHDFQEAQYVADGLHAPEPALLAHSWAASFVAEAASAIQAACHDADNAVFLLYDYAYAPAATQPKPSGPLRFVGAFGYIRIA